MRVFTTILAVLGLSSMAHAALLVTGATVHHDYSGAAEFGIKSSTPLSNASPGNHFSTYDGMAGATLDINPNDGLLRVDTWGRSSIPVQPGYSFLTCSGSIRFTALDGDFTATPLGGGAYTSVTFTLTQLATGLSREMRSNGYVPPTSTGTLNFPAAAGDYELTWISGQGYMVGTTRPGFGQLGFAITPEPIAITTLGGLMFLRRRRV